MYLFKEIVEPLMESLIIKDGREKRRERSAKQRQK